MTTHCDIGSLLLAGVRSIRHIIGLLPTAARDLCRPSQPSPYSRSFTKHIADVSPCNIVMRRPHDFRNDETEQPNHSGPNARSYMVIISYRWDVKFRGCWPSHLEQFTSRSANCNSLPSDVRSTFEGPPVWLIGSASEDYL